MIEKIDEEKFLFKKEISLEDTEKYLNENMLDVIALGFDSKKTNFIIVVAPISTEPDINLIETFLISPEEGINFKPKVWHFPLIATENSNFLTIDKKDSANNLEIYNFQNNDKIFLDYE